MKAAPRTPAERSGMALCERNALGHLLPMDALTRFAAKCRFEPTTGCVLWTGGTTSGRGNSALYGSFWYKGQRWFAHRWAAVHIHGLPVDGMQVGHNCPHCPPNTLCVEHVGPQTQLENLAEQMARGSGACATQAPDERQHWLFVSLGIRELPPTVDPPPDEVPFYEPPPWLRPFLTKPESLECPF